MIVSPQRGLRSCVHIATNMLKFSFLLHLILIYITNLSNGIYMYEVFLLETILFISFCTVLLYSFCSIFFRSRCRYRSREVGLRHRTPWSTSVLLVVPHNVSTRNSKCPPCHVAPGLSTCLSIFQFLRFPLKLL